MEFTRPWLSAGASTIAYVMYITYAHLGNPTDLTGLSIPTFLQTIGLRARDRVCAQSLTIHFQTERENEVIFYLQYPSSLPCAVTTADRLLYIYVCQLHKESFFNCVDQILPIIDHLPTPGQHWWRKSLTVIGKNLNTVDISSKYYLSTSSCQRSLRTALKTQYCKENILFGTLNLLNFLL